MTEPLTTSNAWRRLLSCPNAARAIAEPAPGYYRTKLRRGGPWVAARIWQDDAGTHCIVADQGRDADAAWPSLQAITPEAYAALQQRNRTDPRFDPTSTIDLTKEISTP